jgi:processive 1,2-diacylglycerol beta-glucosyltransferase
MPPRLLVITAAFGEGHNSAARNLALALEAAGAVTHTADPCLLGAPFVTDLLRRGYRLVTTHSPKLWEKIYRSTDRQDFRRQRLPLMRKPESYLAGLIDEFHADAVVSTYPLYPYFLERIFEQTGRRLPVFTAVTDSIEINAAWLKAPCDRWLVTDPATRETMIRSGLAAERVVDTGFPVHPDFARLEPISADDPCDPFRILFFPTAKLPYVRRLGRPLLDASPSTRITIVLGRNVRLLYRKARDLQRAYPGRVRIIGWTQRVPQLLNSHHLVVGKAGGATVHEAIAARCPMFIHHLVPGQEEGNLALLESIGAGGLATSAEALRIATADLLADRAARWRSMKQALARHGRNAGAVCAANYILERLKTPQAAASVRSLVSP